ncbi:MAG TPA: YcnI family protein [Acidimicrobiales bacterium]
MLTKVAVVLTAALATVVLWGAAAEAHVTVSPSSLPQGTGDAILTFRVPNESIVASVTGLRVQFPLAHPIVVVSPEAGSGWTVKVQTTHLSKPLTTDDGTFTSIVSEIDWSGGSIPIGQFGEFNVLAQGIPSGTDELIFKAIQEYSDGTTVSWIQIPDRAAPNPAHPAPTLTLTAPGRGSAAGSSSTTAPSASGPATAAVASGDGHVIALVSLIVAGFALLLALLAVWLGRPRVLGGETPAETNDPTPRAEIAP